MRKGKGVESQLNSLRPNGIGCKWGRRFQSDFSRYPQLAPISKLHDIEMS